MARRFARIDGAKGPVFAELDGPTLWLLDGAPHGDFERTGAQVPRAGAKLLPPVSPSKIVCIGRNYRAHAEELGNAVPDEPLLFLKPPSSLLAPHDQVVLPPQSQRVEHEVELGVVIGKRAQGIDAEHAADHIAGYTVVGDITARDLQKSDKTWTRGKGFDTFCPVGPLLVCDIDASALRIACTVNGEVRQDGNTRDMVFSPATLIAYISHVMTLEPGDLIATGTPEGVGGLTDGDEVVMSIETVGELRFGVQSR